MEILYENINDVRIIAYPPILCSYTLPIWAGIAQSV
jgi:hypothetical protein